MFIFRISTILTVLLFVSGCSQVSSVIQKDAEEVCNDRLELLGKYPTDHPEEWLSHLENNIPNDTELNRLREKLIDAILDYQSSQTLKNYNDALITSAKYTDRCTEIFD